MLKSKLLPPLIAVAALMLVVSGSLAAVLLSRDNGPPTQSAGLAVASPTAGVAAAASPTPAPTISVIAEIPPELRARFDALPEKLQMQALEQLQAGLIGIGQIEEMILAYENRNPGVRVGSVLASSSTSVKLEVYTTGEEVEVTINNETVLRRGSESIGGTDLRTNELVMVLSMDGGTTAFSVTAFGVAAPD